MSETISRSGRFQSIVETVALVTIATAIALQAITNKRPSIVQSAAAAQAARSARPSDPPIPAEPLSLDGAAVTGAKTASVVLIVYSDYQCPFCGKFEHETFPVIKSRYVEPGRLRIAFREFPLSMHPYAEKAAEAAECAGLQGHFWEMHDQLFQHQEQLGEDDLRKYAGMVGLSSKAFDKCLAGATASKVKADIESGQGVQVSGTPTFFVGTVQPDGRVKVARRWSGAQPIEQVETTLDWATGTDAPKNR